MKSHLFEQILEESFEEESEERAGQIESFVADVISIVQLSSA